MSASDTIDYGILRLVVDQPVLALEKVKEAGFTASLTKAIAIGISDQPEPALNHAMEVIRDNDLSVEYPVRIYQSAAYGICDSSLER